MPAFTQSSRAAIRSFSILARARAVARSAEAHPFERYPTTQKVARADWGKQVRHVGDAAMFYFPFMAVFLTWPIIVGKALDGHM